MPWPASYSSISAIPSRSSSSHFSGGSRSSASLVLARCGASGRPSERSSWVRSSPAESTRCSTLVTTGWPLTVVVKARKLTGSSVGTEITWSCSSTLISGIGNATSTVTGLSDLLKKR